MKIEIVNGNKQKKISEFEVGDHFLYGRNLYLKVSDDKLYSYSGEFIYDTTKKDELVIPCEIVEIEVKML